MDGRTMRIGVADLEEAPTYIAVGWVSRRGASGPQSGLVNVSITDEGTARGMLDIPNAESA